MKIFENLSLQKNPRSTKHHHWTAVLSLLLLAFSRSNMALSGQDKKAHSMGVEDEEQKDNEGVVRIFGSFNRQQEKSLNERLVNLELKMDQVTENVSTLFGLTSSFKLIEDNISKIWEDIEEVKSTGAETSNKVEIVQRTLEANDRNQRERDANQKERDASHNAQLVNEITRLSSGISTSQVYVAVWLLIVSVAVSFFLGSLWK
jgi:hypothetical protein